MQEIVSTGSGSLSQPVGLRGLAYYAGESVPIESLPCMAADSALLQRFKQAGFKHVARSSVSMAEQAVLSARETIRISGLGAQEIDAVIVGTSELRDWNVFPETLSTDILKGLGLNNILVAGVSLAGCANVASSLRTARNMIVAEGLRNVLVIETNQVRGSMNPLVGTGPSDMPACVFADGAVSFIATADVAEFKAISMAQTVKLHTSAAPTPHEVIAKNISSSRHVIDQALATAGLVRDDIQCVLFSNLNFRSVLGTINALGFPNADFFLDNIGRYGHIWSADNLINLHDYCEKKSPPAGTNFLLVSQANNYYSAIVCRKEA